MKREDYNRDYNSNYNDYKNTNQSYNNRNQGNYNNSNSYNQGNQNSNYNNQRNTGYVNRNNGGNLPDLYTNLLKVEFIKEISAYVLESVDGGLIIESNNINKLTFSLKKSLQKTLNEIFKVYDIIGKYIFSPVKLKSEVYTFKVKYKNLIKKLHKSPSSQGDKEEIISICSPTSFKETTSIVSNNEKSGSTSTDFDIKEEIEEELEFVLRYDNNLGNIQNSPQYETMLINRRVKDFYKSRKGIIEIGRSGIFDFNQAFSTNKNIIGNGKFLNNV